MMRKRTSAPSLFRRIADLEEQLAAVTEALHGDVPHPASQALFPS